MGLYPRSLLGDTGSVAATVGCGYGWIYGAVIILIALLDLGSNIFFQHLLYLRKEPVCHNLMPHLIA